VEALSEFEDQQPCGRGIGVVEVDIAFESGGDVVIENDEGSEAFAGGETFGCAGKFATIAKDGGVKMGLGIKRSGEGVEVGKKVETFGVGGAIVEGDVFSESLEGCVKAEGRTDRIAIRSTMSRDQDALGGVDGCGDLGPEVIEVKSVV